MKESGWATGQMDALIQVGPARLVSTFTVMFFILHSLGNLVSIRYLKRLHLDEQVVENYFVSDNNQPSLKDVGRILGSKGVTVQECAKLANEKSLMERTLLYRVVSNVSAARNTSPMYRFLFRLEMGGAISLLFNALISASYASIQIHKERFKELQDQESKGICNSNRYSTLFFCFTSGYFLYRVVLGIITVPYTRPVYVCHAAVCLAVCGATLWSGCMSWTLIQLLSLQIGSLFLCAATILDEFGIKNKVLVMATKIPFVAYFFYSRFFERLRIFVSALLLMYRRCDQFRIRHLILYPVAMSLILMIDLGWTRKIVTTSYKT